DPRGHAQSGRRARARSHGKHRGGQERRFHRARRQPARQHFQHAQDQQSVLAWKRSHARRARRKMAGRAMKEESMSCSKWFASSLAVTLVLAAAAQPARSQTLYQGARLITGDGSVIENSAFLVRDNLFTQVGRKGEIALPAGGTRVDLTGKTVMPA